MMSTITRSSSVRPISRSSSKYTASVSYSGSLPIEAVEEGRVRAPGAIRDGVQRARGPHQLEDLLADAMHVDGERNAAEADERNAKFLLPQDPEPLPSLHRARRVDPYRLVAFGLQRLENLLARAAGRASPPSRRAWRPWPARRGTAADARPRECWRRGWPSRVAICPSTPGRSGMVRRKETMRCSRSSSRTITEARMRGSMLPPHRISPTLRPRNRSGLASMAREPGRAGAFRHGLLQGEIGVDRPLEMRLVDQHDLGDELAHDRQRERAHVLDRDAFRQRRAAERAVLPAERVPERGIKRRLRPDDLDRGLTARAPQWRCRRSARRRRSGSPACRGRGRLPAFPARWCPGPRSPGDRRRDARR